MHGQQNIKKKILTFCWPCISVYLSQYLTNLMHKICFTISFISCLYMFRAHVLIMRRSKLYYTASAIITPLGGRPVHRLGEDWLECRLVHGLRELSQPVHETATYMCDDTRGCVMQFWPPGDQHMCSKHVEAWNELIVKQIFCASSWLITEINQKKLMSNSTCPCILVK